MKTSRFDLVPLNIFFYIFDMLFGIHLLTEKILFQYYCNLFGV